MQEHRTMSLQLDTRLSHKPQLFRALIFRYAFAALLLTHPHGGRSQQIGQPQPLVAMVGDDVTLPCHVKPATDAVNVMVEWSRRDLQPRFVHMRRGGEDRLVDQNPSYKGRTSVAIDGLKQGDTSLRLSKVKLSDEGTYRCFVPDLDTDSSVQLVVDVIKITKFSSGVLECKYSGSYPESELLWLDSEGKRLSAGPTETVRGPDDLYTVSSNLTVEKGHSNSFTCRAQEKSTSQTKEKHISVPDDFFSDTSSSSAPVIIGFFVAIIAILAVVFGVWKWKQHKKKTGNYKTDEENGETSKKNSVSIESEQNSLMERATEHYTAPSTEETRLLGQTEPEKLRTKGESDNVVIQRQSEDAGMGSQSVMENGGQNHEVQKGGETMNTLDNTEKRTESLSEETQTSSLAEGKRNQDKPEENTDMRAGEEESKSTNTGTAGEGVTDGDGHQENEVRGEAKTDLDKEVNKKQTTNKNNEPAAQGPTDEGTKEHDPPAGGQTMNNSDNSKDATKPLSEETRTPGSSDPDTSQDKPEIDPENGDKGTKSVNTGTKGQGLKDEGGQQQDTTGGGANTNLNVDGNKEQKKTAGQSPSDGGVQENDHLVNNNKNTLQPLEGGGEQAKNSDSKDGAGDTTPANDTHNTTTTPPETKDKEDKVKEKNSTDNGPAEPDPKGKDTPQTAEGGQEEKTPGSRDGGDSTTSQSALDEAPGADEQNHSHNKDENNKTNSADNNTAAQALTAGGEDKHQTGDKKNNKEDNNSLSNQTGPPSSENTETAAQVQTEEQEIGSPC